MSNEIALPRCIMTLHVTQSILNPWPSLSRDTRSVDKRRSSTSCCNDDRRVNRHVLPSRAVLRNSVRFSSGVSYHANGLRRLRSHTPLIRRLTLHLCWDFLCILSFRSHGAPFERERERDGDGFRWCSCQLSRRPLQAIVQRYRALSLRKVKSQSAVNRPARWWIKRNSSYSG